MDNLVITEYKEQRVLTTNQIAEAYETNNKVITRNFNNNKERYIEGKHYITLSGEEKKDFINMSKIYSGSAKAKVFYLWTEKGAFLHAKSLNTDTAWEVYDRLIDSYFAKPQQGISPMLIKAVEQLVKSNTEIKNKVSDLEERINNSVPKKKFSVWMSKMVPKYEALMKYCYIDSKTLLHNLYTKFEDLHPDINLNFLKEQYCFVNGLDKCYTSDVIESDEYVKAMFEHMVDYLLARNNLDISKRTQRHTIFD